MSKASGADDGRRDRLVALNGRLRACRRCHEAGFLDERESRPIARDPEPGCPPPRVLLIGQAPGRSASNDRPPWHGASGDRLRDWFEAGGIARGDFYRKIHFAAVTRCYPGRSRSGKGDRLPGPVERSLCRPWLDELVPLLRPEIVLLLGRLAIQTTLGRVLSMSEVIGTGTVREGVRFLPLPHPSGVSRWLNRPDNREAVGRSMAILRSWVEELDI